MGYYLEDFTVGSEITSGGRTLTLDAIIAYATLYDPQSFHIDVEAAAKSPYGGLIASGFQTIAVGFRQFLDTAVLAGTSLGSPGVDEVRWLKPVRPGDTLHTVCRVLEARPSASKTRPRRRARRVSHRQSERRGRVDVYDHRARGHAVRTSGRERHARVAAPERARRHVNASASAEMRNKPAAALAERVAG